MKLIFKILLSFLLLMSLVFAADFTPQGDINLRNTYSIINATDISMNSSTVNITRYRTGCIWHNGTTLRIESTCTI